MVSVAEVGEEGLQESQGRDDAAQVASARRGSGKTPQPRLGRMGKVLQVRVSVASVRESERLRAVSPVQVPQQEEPAAVSAEIRRDVLRRTTGTRAYSPHQKEVLPMTSVSHGKPCAGNPHARFEEGASASEIPRRNALLHNTIEEVYGGAGERLACSGVEFIPCHVHGKDDNLTQDYLDRVQNDDSCIKSFLIPAIKVGEKANDDGFYPVYRITCHYEGCKVVVDRSEDLKDFENGVFFDVENKRVMFATQLSSKSADQDVIIGKVTGCCYKTSLMWYHIVTKADNNQ